MSSIQIFNCCPPGDGCANPDCDGCCQDNSALIVPRGQCLDVAMSWEDVDATGMVVSVIEASHPILMELVITPIAPETAEYNLYLSPESMKQLPEGRLSWFRMAVTPPDGPNRVTPKAWIDIQ